MLHDYLFPNTVDAALTMLKDYSGQAKLIAGGTDLILQESRRKNAAKVLVDLSRVHDLLGITEKNGFLIIGSGVTHAEAAASPLVCKHAYALAMACAAVGGKQIRNIGTLGGNIVTGQPAADAAVALTGLEATCLVRTCDGLTQEKSMQEMYSGVCASAIDCCAEILTHIRVPLCKTGEGSSYQRMEQRKALSLPMLCVSVKLSIKKDAIAKARIAIAPVGPGPQRATSAEAFLLGKKPTEDTFIAAAELARQHAAFRSSSVRGSKEFRETVLPVFVTRALREAASRALGGKA